MDTSTDFNVIIATLGIAVFAIFLIWLILNIVGFWKAVQESWRKGLESYRSYLPSVRHVQDFLEG